MLKQHSKTVKSALDISSATTWLTPDLLKALAILLDTTVKSAVDQEDKKTKLKIRKQVTFL